MSGALLSIHSTLVLNPHHIGFSLKFILSISGETEWMQSDCAVGIVALTLCSSPARAQVCVQCSVMQSESTVTVCGVLICAFVSVLCLYQLLTSGVSFVQYTPDMMMVFVLQ